MTGMEENGVKWKKMVSEKNGMDFSYNGLHPNEIGHPAATR
jgi:hypothetical protein